METGYLGLVFYLVIINLAAFAAYGIDKRRAVKKKWRIPERYLLGLAVVGGSAGALCGMYTFRHKTRHKKFTIGVPVIFLIQIAVLYFY